MVENRATVRRTAHVFSISKSTVHKDVTIHLRQINPALFAAVKLLLEENKQMRHLRGGEATRQKYLQTNGVVKRKQD
jgi:putative DeoR family transcriptional regulator (stage III sporulation protein D)